ncbi:MAG: hypothetical protein R3B83_02795 [Nitrospirales bacterium]|nr:hypothetical protein [Nitrospirales bacterium]
MVIDGTRPETIDVAIRLHQTARQVVGTRTLCTLLLNKHDLAEDWKVDPATLGELSRARPVQVAKVSAKTGDGVSRPFPLWLKRC